MNSSDFDQRFDAGESVLEALDLGVTRQSIIKVWLAATE